MIKHTETWDGHILLTDKKYKFLTVIKDILPEISEKITYCLAFTDNERMVPILDYLEKHCRKPLFKKHQ